MKKTLLFILAFCIISVSICGYAAEDKVLYAQDYKSYKGGRFEALNAELANGTWTAMPSDKFLEKGEADGNTYLKLVNDSDTATINMTFKFKEKISDGIVVFNYDLAHSGKVSNVPRIRLHDDSNTERLALFINADSSVKKVCGPKPDFKSNVSFSATNVQYKDITADTPISVMQVLNLDEDYFETYIDGVLLDRVEKLPFRNIISWGLYGYNTISYFDNLSIKILGDVSISAKAAGTTGGGSGVEITIPDSLDGAALKMGDISVTDKNGAAVAIKSISAEGNKVTATFVKALEYDEKYTVKLNVKDIYGRAFEDVSFMSKSEVDENGKTVLRVKSVTGITAKGETVEITDGVTPEITSIRVEFNTFVSAFENGIKLNGKALEGVIDEKSVVLETGGVLTGNTDYVLAVDGNVKSADKTGAIPGETKFRTAEGALSVVEFGWYGEDGKTPATELSEGAKLRLIMKTANTTEADENIFLSYSAFSGKAQKGFGFVPVQVKSGEYKTTELEYTVSGADDIRGIVFDDFLSLIPITDYATVR